MPKQLARFFRLVGRSLRLRCPACGQGRLYRSLWRMNDTCSHCSVPFAREGGFYLGAIYFNYGLTALIVAIAYPLLVFTQAMPAHTALLLGLGFTVLFPLLIFRHARSLWLGFDEFVDPHGSEVPLSPSEPGRRS